MKCSSCGAEIPDNSKFCSECGNKTTPIANPAEIVPIEVIPTKNSARLNCIIKKYRKTKKLWLIISLSALIVGGTTTGVIIHQKQTEAYQQHLVYVENQKKEAYYTKLTNTIDDLNIQYNSCENACELISKSWHDAIFNNSGEDFNNAIAIEEDNMQAEGIKPEMVKGNATIQSDMKDLQNPYKDYDSTYQLVLQLYNEYTGLYNQAINPTGTLVSYNNDVSSKKDAFNTTLNQIEVVMPDTKSKVSK